MAIGSRFGSAGVEQVCPGTGTGHLRDGRRSIAIRHRAGSDASSRFLASDVVSVSTRLVRTGLVGAVHSSDEWSARQRIGQRLPNNVRMLCGLGVRQS